MCYFFSLVSKGDGVPMYFDWKQRQSILKRDIKVKSADSHTSIADYFGFKGEKEDKLNKFEYNPFTKVFTVDQINAEFDDSKDIKKFCNKLDIKEIVPLNIKPIINPFIDIKTTKVTKKDIELMREWDSVRALVWDYVGGSVWDSVRASVWDSVGCSVGDSVRASVRDYVGGSVWDSVWDSVRASVMDSVMDSVRASVWDSVVAYIAEFVDTKYKHDISSSQKLWHKGLVPSFDCKIWRLHGHKGKILYEISQEDLKNGKF